MDESVRRALQRWPGVPAVYGWLRLSRRGDWWLDGARVRHERLRAFIGRNYLADGRGCWYFQNGPQRVYVGLDATPWIIRRGADGRLETQTGLTVAELREVYLDAEGRIALQTEHGAGLLHDAELDWALERLCTESGAVVDAEVLEQALARPSGELSGLRWPGKAGRPLRRLDWAQWPRVLGFVREPQPEAGTPPRA